jgi:hypothetical protein
VEVFNTFAQFEIELRDDSQPVREPFSWFFFAAIVLVLTLGTVYVQEQKLGLDYIEAVQLARHQSVLNGSAPNPWAYRVLSEYVAEGFLRAGSAAHVNHSVAVGFLSFRLLQNTLLFGVALIFYSLIGLSTRNSCLGIMMLAYAMTYSLFHSDLSFNTYTDVFFYLIGGCVVLAGWSNWWLVPIGFLAALNRETSLFIPFLPLASLAANKGRGWRSWMPQVKVAGICFLVQITTLVFLRVMIHPANQAWERTWHNRQGWPTLWMNLTSPMTLELIGLTVSVLPILAIWNFRALPVWLKGMFVIMVPAWFVIHFLMIYANETRVFLVPIAVVLIPAALYPRESSGNNLGVNRSGATLE